MSSTSAWNLTDWAGISVNRGKTVEAGPEGIFEVAVEFRSEPAMRRLIELTPSERLELGIANDRAMVEFWRGFKRVAE